MSEIADIIARLIASRDMEMANTLVGHARSPRTVAAAVLSALGDAGFVVVPKEPNDAMTEAFADLFWNDTGYGMNHDGVRRYLAAMDRGSPQMSPQDRRIAYHIAANVIWIILVLVMLDCPAAPLKERVKNDRHSDRRINRRCCNPLDHWSYLVKIDADGLRRHVKHSTNQRG